MKNRRFWLLAAVAACVSIAAAADVSGKWKAEFSTPDGTARVNTFTFKMDGGKLSGSVSGGQDETPLKDVKITGDAISFTAERPFGSFAYVGKIAGNEIKLKVTFNDQTFEMTAKKVTN